LRPNGRPGWRERHPDPVAATCYINDFSTAAVARCQAARDRRTARPKSPDVIGREYFGAETIVIHERMPTGGPDPMRCTSAGRAGRKKLRPNRHASTARWPQPARGCPRDLEGFDCHTGRFRLRAQRAKARIRERRLARHAGSGANGFDLRPAGCGTRLLAFSATRPGLAVRRGTRMRWAGGQAAVRGKPARAPPAECAETFQFRVPKELNRLYFKKKHRVHLRAPGCCGPLHGFGPRRPIAATYPAAAGPARHAEPDP